MRVIFKTTYTKLLIFAIYYKIHHLCEHFLCEETSNLAKVFYAQPKIQQSEYFCEHLKFGEDFCREQFKLLVRKKRVKRSFSSLKMRRKKNVCTLILSLTQLTKIRIFSLQMYYVDNIFLYETTNKFVQTPRAHQGYSFYQYVLHLSQRPQRVQRGNLAQRDPTGPMDPAGKIAKIIRRGKNSQN